MSRCGKSQSAKTAALGVPVEKKMALVHDQNLAEPVPPNQADRTNDTCGNMYAERDFPG